MKQILLYTGAVVVLASAVVAYRYVQQSGQTTAHTVTPVNVVQPVKTGPAPQPPAPVVANPGAAPAIQPSAATVVDDGAETDKTQATGTSGAASSEPVVQDEPVASTPVQAGTVLYTAPPNPGAAALGEFARHFQKRLNSMPPEERDAAKLSRQMQGEYNKAHSSLADAIKKSREGK